MPELPDVAGFARYLDATALHQRIAASHCLDDRFVKGTPRIGLQRRLKGAALTGTRRWGKWLFAPLDAGGNLVLHFGMTGDLAYVESSDLPPHTRFVLDFEGGGKLAVVSQRMIGRASFAADVDAFAAEHDLGPDALGDDLDAEAFLQRLEGKRGAIKHALMDQSLIAGIGNVYADEILFQAGLHPGTAVPDLDVGARRGLHRTMRRVLREAARCGGDPEAMPRRWLVKVRGDEDAECPHCGGRLEHARVSGRTAWFCPRCQPRS